MRVVVQRVTNASVEVQSKCKAKIGNGLLVLVGIEESDTLDDAVWLARKIVNLRIFNDSEGIMNLSVKDIDGEVLVVSQFTLHALTKKGNRPSYIRAAKPELAIPLYEAFQNEIAKELGKQIQSGVFGAHMQVMLINDGPVTIIIDTKAKE